VQGHARGDEVARSSPRMRAVYSMSSLQRNSA
jgi:hypothetical protein